MLGEFGVGASFEDSPGQELAVGAGELGEEPAGFGALALARLGLLEGVYGLQLPVWVLVRLEEDRSRALTSKVVEGGVGRDAADPGSGPSCGPVRLSLGVRCGLEPGLLGNVARRVPVDPAAGDQERESDDLVGSQGRTGFQTGWVGAGGIGIGQNGLHPLLTCCA